MILLIVSTIYFEVDLLRGALLTCFVTVIIYWMQGILSFETQVESIFKGFKVMLYPLSTVIGGFFLKAINDDLGMTTYVIEAITPLYDDYYLPCGHLCGHGILYLRYLIKLGSVCVGNADCLPDITCAWCEYATYDWVSLSASSFGSHACFFSDSSLLAAQGAGCSPMQHAFTQFPYAMLGAALSVAAFLGLGYMMA